MITKEEIRLKAATYGLNPTTIEKDYVLGWILLAISEHPVLSKEWVFKGGTCLRKCYFEEYRFSEDCDFTILGLANTEIYYVQRLMDEMAQWVTKKSGILIDTNRSLFEEVTNSANQTIVQGRLFYNAPISPQSPRQWPRIKFDLTSHEKLVFSPEKRAIFHNYSDNAFFKGKSIECYNFYDIFSEKIRALFERTRPRDLYDVVEIANRSTDYNIETLRTSLKEKCLFKEIKRLDLNSLNWALCQKSWEDQLAHQIPKLTSFQSYRDQFTAIVEHLNIDNIQLC